jgi:ATP-dependent DNA helicase RecG
MPEASARLLAEKLIAFANGEGGTVVLGFDERGRQVNHIAVDELESLLRQAVGMCLPLVPAHIQPSDVPNGGPSHIISVPPSKLRHVLAIERTAPADAPPIDLVFEEQTVPGASLEDFDTAVLQEFIAKREERTRRKIAGDVSDVLREIGALDPRGQPTVAGVLLFAKNPNIFLKSSGVTFVKFPGVEMRAEGGAMGYGRREEIIGPLSRVVERTWDVVFEEMRVGAVVKGKQREDVLEYPELAVREALVNAICHRDYSITGRRIEVRKFSDRLEVISPGGLAGYMTLDNLIEEHYSRNSRLVQGLYHWGYIEELGLGIDRIYEEMASAGHPPPRFEATPYNFRVILSNYRERNTRNVIVNMPTLREFHTHNILGTGQGGQSGGANLDAIINSTPPSLTVTERQARALQYLREHGRITNGDYQTLCPTVSGETLRTDLADLVSKGVLMKVGEKKGTYYILK